MKSLSGEKSIVCEPIYTHLNQNEVRGCVLFCPTMKYKCFIHVEGKVMHTSSDRIEYNTAAKYRNTFLVVNQYSC